MSKLRAISRSVMEHQWQTDKSVYTWKRDIRVCEFASLRVWEFEALMKKEKSELKLARLLNEELVRVQSVEGEFAFVKRLEGTRRNHVTICAVSSLRLV